MPGAGLNMHTHSIASLSLMWFVMMTTMMAPTVWPWAAAYRKLDPAASGFSRTTVFLSGYAAAWLLYSIAAASIQLLLPHDLPKPIAAGILFTAGAFQFAPLKRACLMHCRNPLTYFLTRWRDGAAGGFGMGFHHGLFCVACCWALMATTIAVGIMSLWWMAALAVVTFAEQVSPWGDKVRIAVGILLIASAVL